jgi:O-antigen ligase
MAITSGTAVETAGGWRHGVQVVAAPALGAAVPLLVFGRSALAVVAAIAILGLLTTTPWRRLVADINAAMKTPLSGAIWLTFGLWLMSVAGSYMIERSIPVWLRMAALLIVGIALCAILRPRPDLQALAQKALIAAGLVAAPLAILALTVASDPYVWLMGHGAERDIPGIAAAVMKSYGTAIAMAMPAVLWAGFRRGGAWRWAGAAFQVLGCIVLVLLESRAGLIAAGLGLGVLAFWYALSRRRGWLLLLVVPVIAAVFAGVFMDNQRNNTIDAALGLPTWMVDAHRQSIWAFSMQYLPGAPWLGHGIDTINHLPGAGAVVPGSTVEYVPSHPHNFAVEVLVETGLLGFAAMASALVLLAAGLIRAARRDGAPGAALLAVSAAFWFVNLISYSFWSYWWQACYIVLTALIAASLTPGLMSAGLQWKRR